MIETEAPETTPEPGEGEEAPGEPESPTTPAEPPHEAPGPPGENEPDEDRADSVEEDLERTVPS